jgi:hypothetical protein
MLTVVFGSGQVEKLSRGYSWKHEVIIIIK